MISVSLYNPIRFMNVGDVDFLRNFDCSKYFQKWQNGDTLSFQILSDEIFYVTIRNLDTKAEYRSVTIYQQSSSLQDPEFKIYEANINFDETFDQGWYYIQIVGSDGMIAISYPFEYFESQDETILLRYYNSENKTGLIFETGIEFYIRVEGALFDFSPMSDSEVYFDQSKNPVLLYSQPYRQFNLNFGRNKGISEWMADIINYAFSCDQKFIDGKGFERNEGADFEPIRVDNTELMGMNIEVVQKKNNSSDQLKNVFILGDSEGNSVVNNNNFIANGY